jgi:hypothetical protein
VSRLRRAALIAFVAHLVAGLAMALVLGRGLETTPGLEDRLAFIVNYRASWTMAWLTWSVAAIAILYYYAAFAEAHELERFPVLLTIAALGPDLAAQAIEIGVLPGLAATSSEHFLTMHRVAVMLSGFLANGLYSLTALLLVWGARRAYPAWLSVIGFAVGIFGFALSAAALLNSVAGMFWTNVLLVPTLLLWLVGVAVRRNTGSHKPFSSKTIGEFRKGT